MDRRRVVFALAGFWALWAEPVVHAQVAILQNDNFETTGSCAPGVAMDETIAARLTAPASLYPYTIQSIQVLTCGLGESAYAADVWQDDGAGPNPGALIWTSGADAYMLGGDLVFNQIVPSVPIIVTAGTVRVGLFHLLEGPPSFVIDQAILPQRNLIRTDAGAWSFAENRGVTGDFVLRLTVKADTIFRDGFESGTPSAWSSAQTDGGDLTVDAAAALHGTTAGLKGVIDDTHGIYVEDQLPQNENRYRARFYFDPHDFDPGEAQGAFRTRIFILFEEAPTRRLAALVLRRQGGVYSLMGRARLDDNSQTNTGFFTLTPGPHMVEVDWKRSTGLAANNGSFQMWIDNASVATLSGLDNSISAVDFVRLGALSVKAGASGTMYWDEFVSRRQGYVGP